MRIWVYEKFHSIPASLLECRQDFESHPIAKLNHDNLPVTAHIGAWISSLNELFHSLDQAGLSVPSIAIVAFVLISREGNQDIEVACVNDGPSP